MAAQGVQARRRTGQTSGWVHRATLSRGEQRLQAVDNVVICAVQDSLAERMPVDGEAVGGARFHKIGGAAVAAELDAKRAIREGQSWRQAFDFGCSTVTSGSDPK